MNRIKKGDTVVVLTGKSKGHVGLVLQVKDQLVLVEGANVVKKHVKPNSQLNEKGGIVSKEAALQVSNVALYNSATQKADKVGFRFVEKDGITRKVRYFKSNNEVVDLV